MAGLAEFESARNSERVTAGIERVRAPGKHIGCPAVDETTIEQMRELRRKGGSYSDIQQACRRVGRPTVVKSARIVGCAARGRRSGTKNYAPQQLLDCRPPSSNGRSPRGVDHRIPENSPIQSPRLAVIVLRKPVSGSCRSSRRNRGNIASSVRVKTSRRRPTYYCDVSRRPEA